MPLCFGEPLRCLLPCTIAALALAFPVAADAESASEPSGPEISLRYIGDAVAVVDGGLERRARGLGRFDIGLSSGDDFLGLSGVKAHIDIMLVHGGGLSDDVIGDGQVASNVDAPWAVRPFEAWVEAPLGAGVRAKAGYIDLNSEFDVQPVGATFLNSSFGIAPDYSQSGQNGPSIFPVTSPGIVVAIEKPRWSVKFALFDALPGDPARPHRFAPPAPFRGGLLLAAEGDAKVGSRGEVQFGGWTYTDPFDRIDGNGTGRSWGSYAQYGHRILGDEDGDSLKGWIRVGYAADTVNVINLYTGGGVRLGNDDRHLGFGVAHARRGDPAVQQEPGRRAETAFELTGYYRFAPWLAVQPDVQYIKNPGWLGTPDALVLGLRLHLSTAFGIGEN